MISNGHLMFSCPAVVPVLAAPVAILAPILWGLTVAFAGGIVALFKPSGLKNFGKLLWRQKLAATMVAAVTVPAIYGCCALVSGLFAGSAGALESGAAQKGSDWTTARCDVCRTGAVPGTASPNAPKLIWSSFKNGQDGFLSSPAVVGNRVYVASLGDPFEKLGKIYCLDADTGAVVWATAPKGYRPTFSSPVVAGDYLVVGEGVHDTKDARVTCLDISAEGKGKILWTTAPAQDHVECTPVIAQGKVYFGAGDDGLFCYDLQSGPDGTAKLNWHLPHENFCDCETSLAVHDGKIYLGLGMDDEEDPNNQGKALQKGRALCVLDAATGALIRRLPMPHPVFSPSSIAAGKLYLGMGEGDYVDDGKNGEAGEVRCLDLATLATEWSFQLDRTVLGAVAIRGDRLYFGCKDGRVYSLSTRGKELARFDAHAPILASPAVTDKAVYVVSTKGLLYALEPDTLALLWEFRLGTQGYFMSSPVVARGHVYVGTSEYGFLCVGEVDAGKQSALWANPLGGRGRAGNDDNSPIPTEAKVLWSFPTVRAGSVSDGPGTPAITAPVACCGDDLYVPYAVADKAVLACLPKKSAAAPKPRWEFPVDGKITQAPVVWGDNVVFVAAGQLHCLDRESGTKIRWTLPVDEPAIVTATPWQVLVAERGRIRKNAGEGGAPRILANAATVDDQDRLTSVDSGGNVRWSLEVGALRHAPAASSTMIVLATENKPAVIALDRETGAVLWQQNLDKAPTTSPVLGKSVFYLGSENGVTAYSLLDGRIVPGWHHESAGPSAELAMDNQHLYHVNTLGELVVIERKTGEVALRVSGAVPGFVPLVSRDAAVVATAKGLRLARLDQKDAQFEPWVGKGQTGPIAGPAVLSDARVFVPTRTKGLVCIGSKE